MQESTLHFFNPGARYSANRIGQQNRGPSRKRGLRFEPLEDRRMLSVLFVDDDAAGGGDGTAWGTAFDDLQPALEAAAAFNSDVVAENDVTEIWIAEGTYMPSATSGGDVRRASFSLVDGVTLYGGFGGSETALSQRDFVAHETVFSGDIGVIGDNSDNVQTVVVCGRRVAAALDGVTVSGGNAEWGNGGGVYSEGTLSVLNSDIRDNVARSGGGIYASGTLTITNSTVRDNATGEIGQYGGGGIYAGNCVLTIVDSTISDNTSSGLIVCSGGGIYADNSQITIESSTVTGNSASRYGGGICVFGMLSVNDSDVTDNAAREAGGGVYCSDTLVLSDSTLSGNTVGSEEYSYPKGGGAVYGGGDVTITNCVISDNDMIAKGSGNGYGGGVYAVGALNVADSVFSSNHAHRYGGGIFAQGPLTISRSEFYGNVSGTRGGAICADAATMTNVFFGGNTSQFGGALDLHTDSILSNCAFVGNSASRYGGAVVGSGEWTIANSTFTQNTADYSHRAIDAYGTANVTNSIFWQNDGGDLAGNGDFIVNSSLVGIDPHFRENPSDGGDGWGDDSDTPDVDESANDNYGDLRLTASSPAVNAGQSDLLVADVTDLDGDGDTAEPVPFDISGEARVWGDSPDAGAYELQADPTPGREAPAVVVTTSDDVGDFYDGAISLREALWYAGADGLGTRITFDASLDGATIVLDGTELLIDKMCTIDASSLDSLTIDADGRSRVFQVLGEENQAVGLIGLTIAGGNRYHGGGLYNRGDDTTIAGCTFFDNTASFDNGYDIRPSSGGGLYNRGTLAVVNSVFLANEGVEAAICNEGELALSNSTFVQNNSPSGDGAVVNRSENPLQIDNSIFWQNEGGNVGGEGIIGAANCLIGVDPRFVAEPSPGADEEWGTQDDALGDLRLTDTSPAVDGGNSGLLPADSADLDGDGDTSEPIPFDRAATARIQADSVDVGAYEFDAAPAAGRETPSVVVTTAEDVFDMYDGEISLREAIWYAGGLGAETTIRFDSTLDEATLLLGGSELAVQNGLTIDASDLTSLTVDAGYGSRAFLNFEGEAMVTLSGLSVIRGREDYHGGAIFSYGPLALTNSVLSGNTSNNNGGAVYAAASLSITDSILSGNEANYDGGAVCAAGPVTVENSTISDNSTQSSGGGFWSSGSLTIENSTLSGNSTHSGSGGAIQSNGQLTILNSTIAGNTAGGYGGAISAFGETEIGNSTLTRNESGNTFGEGGGAIWFSGGLTIESSTVSENTSVNGGGGISGAGTLTLANSRVEGNSASGGGGGIYLRSGTGTLTNTVLSGNASDGFGGGIYAYETEVTMANTMLVGNSASDGGGVYSGGAYSRSRPLTLSNCTLTANTAQNSAGGVYFKDPEKVTINNTIIAGNTTETDHPDLSTYYPDLSPSGSHNLIGNGDSQYVFTNGRNGNLVGTPASPIDPLFLRAPSDGGDGWGDDPDTPNVDESANDDYGDLRLAAGSPAIDHGSRAALPADEFDLDGDGDIAEPIPVDLAGEGRIQSVAVDIGAYEYVVDPDLDNDGMVGSGELDIVRGNWGAQVTPGDRVHGDFSGDGVVDSTDLTIVRMHFGEVAVASAADAVFASEESEMEADETVYGPLAQDRLLSRSQSAEQHTYNTLAALAHAAWQQEMAGRGNSSGTAKPEVKKSPLFALSNL